MKLFIAVALLILMLRNRKKKVYQNASDLLHEKIVDFASLSTAITKVFKQKCQHTMNLRIKSAQHVVFSSPGHKYILLSRTKDIDKIIETYRLQEMPRGIKNLKSERKGCKLNMAKWQGA